MPYPHIRRIDTPGVCRCGNIGPRHQPEWGDDCPAAMKARIDELAVSLVEAHSELNTLRHHVRQVVPYVTATIGPGCTHDTERRDWIEAHRGRCDSSLRQLVSLERAATPSVKD